MNFPRPHQHRSSTPAGLDADPELLRRGNALFWLWEEADRLVPFRWLYRAEALPRVGHTARDLDELVRFEFLYRITDGFVARVSGERGALGPAILRRESYQYEFTPVRDRSDLLTPSQAMEALLQDLERREREFWERILKPEEVARAAAVTSFVHFNSHGWDRLRLEQPFAAGIREPFYQFRKACTEVEFWVGALTGTVTIRPGVSP